MARLINLLIGLMMSGYGIRIYRALRNILIIAACIWLVLHFFRIEISMK